MPVPRTKPEMMRPSLSTSSIATASATRTGLECSGSALPMMPMGIFDVRATICDPMTLGSGMVPYAFWWCSLTHVPS